MIMEEDRIQKPVSNEIEKSDDKLPPCTTAPSAEHARASNVDEPCDDARSGEIDSG